MRVEPLAILLLAACGATAAPPTAPASSAIRTDGGPSASPSGSEVPSPPACDPADTRLILAPGETRTIDAEFTVTFVTLQLDHYDDGGYDMIAQLDFRRGALTETRLVSLLAAHGPERLLESCVRISAAEGDQVAVEVGLASR